jgi:hypothetical protein
VNRARKSISDIITEQSLETGISQRLLRSGNRRHNISLARAVIAKTCAEEAGLSFADIARALGVSTSAIRRSVLRITLNSQAH